MSYPVNAAMDIDANTTCSSFVSKGMAKRDDRISEQGKNKVVKCRIVILSALKTSAGKLQKML